MDTAPVFTIGTGDYQCNKISLTILWSILCFFKHLVAFCSELVFTYLMFCTNAVIGTVVRSLVQRKDNSRSIGRSAEVTWKLRYIQGSPHNGTITSAMNKTACCSQQVIVTDDAPVFLEYRFRREDSWVWGD